jgi:hypothetical protein
MKPLCFEIPSIYSSSDTDESMGRWIQRPISYLDLEPRGTILDGLYAHSRFPEFVPQISPELAWEFEAWEALSDEALVLFESGCD